MIAGGISWHEHMCPMCGTSWTCADGEKAVIVSLWCDECREILDK